MKLKFGITLKVTLVVVVASLGIISSQVVGNYYDSQVFFGEILNQHSLAVFKALDASVKDILFKNNSENLSKRLNDFINLNSVILLLNK